MCVCVLERIKGERLTEEDMLFKTVGIVSKHFVDSFCAETGF